MSRISIKITGAQGQGVNSVGEICAKGLKRGGYCVFGYREYMSIIKGGHSSYQLDISDEKIRSTETMVNVLVCFNHYGLKKNLREVKDGGIVLHQTPEWKFSDEDKQWIEDHKVTVLYLPSEKILKEMGLKLLFGNVLIASVVWYLLKQDISALKELIKEQFGKKGDAIIKKNFDCIDCGVELLSEQEGYLGIALPASKDEWKDQMLLTGSQAMGLGSVHAGCRAFFGYPMTPASPLLTFIADIQNRTGMLVKQAEDEITAAQMVIGAMHMGTRAMTSTSGGGYDLMTETVSLAGVSETPAVFVLAQRPGPATGLPTWTAQGDLLLAVHASHGEFPRLVMSVSDAEDCFSLMAEAFNFAEEFQLPVIVMTEKQTAECLYTQPQFDQKSTEVRRGNIVTDQDELAKLKGADRYDPSVKDGISKRWLPGGEAATYCAQSYEHTPDGSFSEESDNTIEQVDKRARKVEALKERLTEPVLYRVESGKLKVESEDVSCDFLIVGWGSTKGPTLDALYKLSTLHSALSTSYLHYTYLWPLKTERLEALAAKAKKVVLVEGNQQGQLGMLIRQECGVEIEEKVLKYDGRPMFVDEVVSYLEKYVE